MFYLPSAELPADTVTIALLMNVGHSSLSMKKSEIKDQSRWLNNG